MTDPIRQFIDAARGRCEKASEIPTDARADWDGSNHYEIQSPSGDSFWWLRCPDIDFDAPVDISATEDGKRLGMVLDLACAARTDLPRALDAIEYIFTVGWMDPGMTARVSRILAGEKL